MNKTYIFLVVILLLFSGCGINKRDKNKQKHGLWIVQQKTSEGNIKTRGKYRHGEQIGVWTTKINDTLFQKDRIKMVENNAGTKIQLYHISTKTYYPSGKLHESGESMLKLDNAIEDNRHWYKFGPWNRYTENGKVILIKYYKEGKLHSYYENDSMHYDLKKFVDSDN